MTKFSTDPVDISAHNSGTCHENVAKPGTDGSLGNIRPARDLDRQTLTARLRASPTSEIMLEAADEIDALREALLWNAAALQACCAEGIRETSTITIAPKSKSFCAILDMADAALAQEKS